MSESSGPKREIACYCNVVTVETVRHAVREKNAHSLSALYDCTGAGIGPCGGSCRVLLRALIQEGKPIGSVAPAPDLPPLPPSELIEAVSLFNRRYYWEAHEVLEHVWMEETGPDKVFYQGLIQAAAALYHVLNANPQGVVKLAAEAVRKLDKFKPMHFTVPLETLLGALKSFDAQAREILGHTRAGFDYDHLPHLAIGEET